MLKILRYIFSAIKELFFIFGIWSPKIDPNLYKSISDFSNVNNSFWKNTNINVGSLLPLLFDFLLTICILSCHAMVNYM